jgi:putative hydrolase of the HAD superfamily
MSRRPRAILFDLDDTLLSAYGRPNEAWLAVAREMAAVIAPLDAEVAARAIGAAAEAFWSDPDRHRLHRMDLKHSRRRIVAGALARLADDGGPTLPPEAAERLADRFTAFRDEQMKLFPDAIETLEALRAEGLRLALVTNGAGESQRAKIARFELERHFDHIQIEGEHGFGKPEERSYRHALATLDVAAADAWMVGDNLEWEVAAPQRLGIFSIWYDPYGDGLPAGSDVVPDRIIRTLPELLRPGA